ncbi:hypothetical protein Fot_20379 [Forsythia ovata]|uniref:Uncharacterized protein n=1 Tax=Forsythia ovata TaxID=205694 RepID=A0ABD1VQF4_9LAMI
MDVFVNQFLAKILLGSEVILVLKARIASSSMAKQNAKQFSDNTAMKQQSLSMNLKTVLCNFITESSSIGLNIGMGVAREQPDQQATAGKPLQESGDSFGIRNTTLSSQIHSAFLKGLKYSGGSYKASVSPV